MEDWGFGVTIFDQTVYDVVKVVVCGCIHGGVSGV